MLNVLLCFVERVSNEGRVASTYQRTWGRARGDRNDKMFLIKEKQNNMKLTYDPAHNIIFLPLFSTFLLKIYEV